MNAFQRSCNREPDFKFPKSARIGPRESRGVYSIAKGNRREFLREEIWRRKVMITATRLGVSDRKCEGSITTGTAIGLGATWNFSPTATQERRFWYFRRPRASS